MINGPDQDAVPLLVADEAVSAGRVDRTGVAAVPLFFAYRAYSAHVSRLEEEYRRGEVVESLDQGMCVVDSNGLVTLWNDALERILDCRRERALGRSLAGALPALARTELPRAIDEWAP